MFERMRESWELASSRTKLLVPLGLIGVLVLFVALVWVLRNWQGPVGQPAQAAAETPVEEAAPEPSRAFEMEAQTLGLTLPLSRSERGILDQHFAAAGGLEKMTALGSMRMNGKVTFDTGESLDVVIVKKKGDRMRVTLKTPLMQRVSVVSADDNWTATYQAGQLVSVADLPAGEREELRRYAPLVSELFQALQKGWRIRYLGQKDFNYKMAHIFEADTGPKRTTRFIIDPSTYLEAGQEERSFGEDGTLQIVRRINHDYFDSNGFKVPRKVETFIDDVLKQTFLVETMETNAGILDNSFDRPAAPPPKPAEEPTP